MAVMAVSSVVSVSGGIGLVGLPVVSGLALIEGRGVRGGGVGPVVVRIRPDDQRMM